MASWAGGSDNGRRRSEPPAVGFDVRGASEGRSPGRGAERHVIGPERIRILARGSAAGDSVFELLPSELAEPLPEGTSTIWIDIRHPREAATTMLLECLEVSSLTLEDLLLPLRMPKVDVLEGSSVFVAAFGARLEENDEPRLRSVEVDLLARPGLLITAHDGSIPGLENRIEVELQRLASGPDDAAFLLAHAALDSVIDQHLPALLKSAEVAEALEESLDFRSERASLASLENLIVLRRDLLSFRRVSVAQNEVLGRLERLAPNVGAYFSDVRDNEHEAIDMADATRDYIDGAIEAYRMRRDERTNGGIRRLTIIASLLGPLTLLTGIYGVNFVDIPGTGHPWGFYIFVTAEVVLAVLAVLVLRRRGLL